MIKKRETERGKWLFKKVILPVNSRDGFSAILLAENDFTVR
jgi:hypothetical protein